MFKKLAISLTAAIMPIQANAAVVDTFDRPDNTTLGTGYTVQNGRFAISGNRAITPTVVALATLDGVTADQAAIDVFLRGTDAGSYVALSFGFDSALSYFVKVQDNDGDGLFDSYGFFNENNNIGDELLSSLSFGFLSGTMSVSVTGSVATLLLTAGGQSQSYSRDYGYAPGSGTVGFGLNRQGVADNLRVEALAAAVPEPATWAFMIIGMGAVGAATRRGRAYRTSAAQPPSPA